MIAPSSDSALPRRLALREAVDELAALAFVGVALGVALFVLPELLAAVFCP